MRLYHGQRLFLSLTTTTTTRRLLFARHFTMVSPATQAAQAVLASIDLSSYDSEQARLMDEKCILVDEDDKAIGAMDKKTCASRPLRYCCL